MNLNDLYPNLYVENQDFDCKARLNRDDSLSWMKTVAGFANAHGGTLFLGVEDKTFKLIGFEQKELDREKLYFHNELATHMAILPSYSIQALPYRVHDAQRFLLKIKIDESSKKPLTVKYNGYPLIFLRRDGFTNPATEEEIRMMVLTSGRPAFDESLTDIDFSMDDFQDYAEFYQERTIKKLKSKELESISFFKNGKLTQGAYLFHDHYEGNKTTIVCSLYRGSTRGDDLIIASNTYKGNLIGCYHFMMDFIKMRMNHGFIKLSDRRIDVDAYPERSLFEAIINALAHRDYLLEGTQINVDMFSNRLVITSPGSIFESQNDLQPTYDLTSFTSKRRNELIARAFILAKAMDAKGTGLEKIMDDYAAYGKEHQPFIYSKGNAFSVVLPDLTNEEGVSVEAESVLLVEPIENPTRFDLAVLSYCYFSEKSIAEITAHLQLSNSTFFRKNVIENLVSQGFLIQKSAENKKVYSANQTKVKLR